MSDNNLSHSDQNGFTDLTEGVAEALADGRSHFQIVTRLVDNSQEKDNAADLVKTVDHHISSTPVKNERGEVASWLIWIGLLALINVLSYLFDWPFWVY